MYSQKLRELPDLEESYFGNSPKRRVYFENGRIFGSFHICIIQELREHDWTDRIMSVARTQESYRSLTANTVNSSTTFKDSKVPLKIKLKELLEFSVVRKNS